MDKAGVYKAGAFKLEGASRSGVTPPGADLVFDIELLDINGRRGRRVRGPAGAPAPVFGRAHGRRQSFTGGAVPKTPRALVGATWRCSRATRRAWTSAR